MNKTLSIGLAGFSFTIEEQAYLKLRDYLDALRGSLDANEADEVMHDIEIRMVEIFKTSLDKRQVINESDVEKVIAQIGSPEIIEEQEEAYYSEKTKSQKKSGPTGGKKQLFRDPERAKLGGVCAGLAHYIGIDVTILRVILVAIIIFDIFFTLAISTMFLVFLYIVLWIVLPKAQSASDFLKMKGKPMNFDNLKEESNKIVQFTNEAGQKVGEMYNESKPYINKASSGIWDIFRYIFGIIFGIIGLSFLLSSFVAFGTSWLNESTINLPGNIEYLFADNNFYYLLIALAFLTLFIPALVFLFLSLKLFSPQTKLNYTGYVFGALVLIWITLVGITAVTAAKQKAIYQGENDETENLSINTPSDTIYVDLKKVIIPQNFKPYWDDVYSDKKLIYKEDYPGLSVIRKEGKFQPYLIINKEAEGYNLPLKMNIPVEIQNNTIKLPNYFSYPYEYRMRDYRLDYELVVPQNFTVIKMKEHGYQVHDEANENKEEENQDNSVNISGNNKKVSINSNGNSVEYDSKFGDSVKINGVMYDEAKADKILDSLDIDFDEYKNVDININSEEKKVSIKTK